MARPCPCLPTPGILCTELILRANFLGAEVSGTVRNGSERFRRPQVCTVKSSCSWFFQVPVSKPSKKPPCGSKDQGYKSKESEKKQKRLLRPHPNHGEASSAFSRTLCSCILGPWSHRAAFWKVLKLGLEKTRNNCS